MAVLAFLLLATRQTFIVPYTGLGLSPAQLLALLLTLAWAVTRLRGGRGVDGLFAWRAVVGTYLLVSLASYVGGAARGAPAEVLTSSDRALVTRIALAGFAVLVVEVVRTRRHLRVVVGTVVAGGAVSALLGLVQFATGVDVAARLKLPGLQALDTGIGETALRAGYARASGAASVPLEFGAVVTVVAPLAAAMLFVARERGRPVWPWFGALVLLVAAGATSLSRSVFVGLAVAFVVLAVGWSLRRLAVVAVLAAGGLVVAWLAAGGLVGDLVSLVTQGSGDFSLQSRSNGRSYVLERVLVHPWLGQGVGTYQTGVQPVLDNQYLSELIETGLLGVVALVAVLATVFVVVSRARVVDPEAEGRELTAGLSAALAVVAVVNLVLDTSGFAQISVLTWLLLGLCGAAAHLARESRRQWGDLPDRGVRHRPPTA